MKTFIEKIKKEREQFNLKLPKGADEDCIGILKSQTVSKFSYTIPNEYLIFLRDVDGLFYNGIHIYSTKTVNQTPQNVTIEGFVEANEMWRDDERKENYLVFAESGDALYVHNLKNNNYEYVDRITLDVIDYKKTCEQLFDLILNHVLDNY